MKLLLASQSPRRKELLTQLGYEFVTVKIDVDESYPDNLKPEDVAHYVSNKKAEHFDAATDEVLITSDTIVALGDKILLKPNNKEEAFEMLKSLSGKKHQVYTAFTIKTKTTTTTKTSKTEVEFSEISDTEISYYIDHYKPYDKAGSYGIQEWLGMAKIKNISGSYYSVMGLPVDLVYEELKKLGLHPNN